MTAEDVFGRADDGRGNRVGGGRITEKDEVVVVVEGTGKIIGCAGSGAGDFDRANRNPILVPIAPNRPALDDLSLALPGLFTPFASFPFPFPLLNIGLLGRPPPLPLPTVNIGLFGRALPLPPPNIGLFGRAPLLPSAAALSSSF